MYRQKAKLTTAIEELDDNRSCDQLATCDKISGQKIKTGEKKSKVRPEDAEPTTNRSGSMKIAGKSERNQEDMVAMMSKLLKQQAIPDIDIDIFSGDPVDYHNFIVVFEEVVEKKIDRP